MSKAYGNTVHTRSLFRGAARGIARRPSGVLVTALCTVFGWAFFVSGPLAADTIVKLNGASIDNVKIIQAKWDLVQYQTQGRGGRAQSVAAAQIASIDREARGSALIEGRAASQKGDYPGAIQPLTSATKRGGSEAWEKAEAAYWLGETYLQAGNAKDAEKQLKTYLKDHEKDKDWWVPHTLYARGTAQIAMKQVESAEESFKKLEDMPGQWSLRAQVGRARAIEASGNKAKFLQARQILLSVARGRTTPVELKDEAYVVRGRIYLRQKQYGEAIKELKSIFFDPSKSRDYRYDVRRAEATYLMGRAYQRLGGKGNLEEAELWLLRVPALYPGRGRVYTLSCRALALVYKDLGNNKRAAEWGRRGRADDGKLD